MAVTCKCKHTERSSVAGETGAMWPAGKLLSVEAPWGDVMDCAEVVAHSRFLVTALSFVCLCVFLL